MHTVWLIRKQPPNTSLPRAAVAGFQAKVAMEMGDYATVISKGKEALASYRLPPGIISLAFGKMKTRMVSLFYIAVEKKDGGYAGCKLQPIQ